MKIILTGKNFKLTPSLKSYVTDKISHLEKYYREILKAKVELDFDRNQKSGDINRVEIWLYLPEKTLETGIKASEMHEAIDLAYEKIANQLIRYKEKKYSRRMRKLRKSSDKNFDKSYPQASK
ncbi:MAG: ribosome-associated translation inhibitor RaiA [Patescibacteria group bacterium]|nr:ribosome-associated translation inhibitor RaiA [Patescibacteria group bacterium]MDD5567349.1 ribosome-associated translation inhibitor RaiA [Patescibacteria group bacterium]